MAEILKFVLSGFWTFAGTCILIGLVGRAIAEIVSGAIHGVKE